ncbi:MAG: hypothetical protein JOZ16_04570 [Methylobacteriaceae bacterium]|nr:hypothetical protein [Methylobacteriaceae bacterium]
MNMHGIMTPVDPSYQEPRRTYRERIQQWAWRRRLFLLVVALPLLITATYLYVFASDQYVSEAHFLVHSVDSAKPGTPGIPAALGAMAGMSGSQNDAMSVADYLTSHDAVATLRAKDRLIERFTLPGIDPFSRLWSSDPTPEQLLKYYRRHVQVAIDADSGIATVTVRAFRPDDAFLLISRLLQLGEERVNVLNRRSYEDAIGMSRRQLADAEAALAQSQIQLTNFRQNRRDIDPAASGQAQITLVSTLTAQLSAARAQLASMGQMINHNSPQFKALQSRVDALSAQVAAQFGRLTGGNQAIAADIGSYEGLQLRQQFLSKRYDAAASNLERAREQALRQQLYLVRVVEPNMPVQSLYPERGRILITLLIALLLAYSIGWLIVAGVREHAA